MTATQSGLHQRLRSGVAWSALSSLVMRLSSLALGMILARLLAPEQFGVFATAMTVQTVLITLADLGLGADLVRSDDPEHRSPSVGFLGLASGSALAGLMAITCGPVARAMGTPDAARVIAVLSVTLVLAGAGVVPYAFLIRRFDQRSIFVIGLVDFAVSTGVTVVLVVAGWGAMSMAVGRVAAQSVTLVLQFVMSGRRPCYAVQRDVIWSVLRFGVPVAGANMLSWALISVDNVVIARSLGPVALGFYVLAFNVANWPMGAIGSVTRSVALPAFARSAARTAGDMSLATGTAVSWALALPAGAMLGLLAGPVITVLYGARWQPATGVLAALCVFGTLRVLFDLFASYLLARGAARATMLIQLYWFVVLVPAVVIAARHHGPTGVGWAHTFVAAGLVLPVYLLAIRHAGASVSAVLRVCWPPLLAMTPPAAVTLFLLPHLDSTAARVLVPGAVGVVLYAALLGRWLWPRLFPKVTPVMRAGVATVDPRLESV